tara:strand:- start:815 stop:1024 length:210 start_codon:yes stop_codon:yes gene_type:complete
MERRCLTLPSTFITDKAKLILAFGHDSNKLTQEIRMKIGSTIFSISDSLKAQIFLKFDIIENSSVFNLE